MKKVDLLAAALVLVGGLNWGLVAIAQFDLVAALGLGVRRDQRRDPDRLRTRWSRGRLRHRLAADEPSPVGDDPPRDARIGVPLIRALNTVTRKGNHRT